MDIVGNNPRVISDQYLNRSAKTGEYFGTSIWEWRPIHALCDALIRAHDLPFTTEGWEYNSGDGLASQEECDLLANSLERHLEAYPPKNGWVCINLGLFVDESGKSVDRDEPGAMSAHCVEVQDVREWITFLRNCGGFRIY